MYKVKLVKVRLNSCVRRCSKLAYSLSSQSGTSPIVKLSVTFPNFRGDECEDVHEFILNNYKRAGRLNGWNGLVHGLKHCLWLIR